MKNIKKINLSSLTGKLTKEQMKSIMAGSSCKGSACGGIGYYCSGGCGCSGSICQ